MTIASLHRTLSRTLLTIGVVSLVACGGGGGGKKKDPAPDTTPNAYSYTATTNAEPSAVITSAPVTITGINAATPVSITGGEYSISGGAFTSAAGTVTSGQTITIRLTAPAANSTSASAQITVGGVTATFTVTTKADTTPDAFAFTAQTNAALNTEYTSNTITVTGIDAATPISVTGGTYSINGGAFTAAAGTVSVSNTVAVKATSASDTEQTRNVVLTIGGVSATYAITTIADTTPPVAEFKFPTPYTMSEANTVKVRGTATDDNAITSVKVVVRSYNLEAPTVTLSTQTIDVTPKAAGDYSSWTADIPLTALAENEVKVIATDEKQNETLPADANKVVIRQADLRSAFPDEINQFGNIFQGLAIDTFGGRNRALIGDADSVISVDLDTGIRQPVIESNNAIRSIVIDPTGTALFASSSNSILEFDLISGELSKKYTSDLVINPAAMTIDKTAKHGPSLIMINSVYSDTSGGSSVGFKLLEKEFYLISPATNEPYLMLGEGVGVDSDNNRYLVPVGGQFDLSLHGIVAVDRDTGEHSLFSSNTVGEGELFGEIYGFDSALITTIVDQDSNRLLVPEYPSKLFSIDLSTGNRKVFARIVYENSPPSSSSEAGMGALDIDRDDRILFVVESNRKALLEIDLESGEKVILSKSKNDF